MNSDDEQKMEIDEDQNGIATDSNNKKQKKLKRENKRKHPEISKNIIKEWEELRQKKVDSERKLHLCENIIKMSKHVILELIEQKTTARVYESVIEFGNEEHRWTIFEIVKNHIHQLCLGKYSAFAIISMLQYGTKEQKLQVFKVVLDNIKELLKQRFSAKIVEYAYNDFANAKQRNEMITSLYGKTFSTYKQNSKTIKLDHIVEQKNFDDAILKDIFKILQPIIQKKMIDLTIVQHLLYEFLNILITKIQKNSVSAPTDKNILNDINDMLRDNILKLCNTREGSKIAMIVYCLCNSKERKIIMSQIKTAVIDICISEHAYLFLLTVLDQTDDVVQLTKYVIKPLLNKIDEIIDFKSGRKVLQFIMNHRSPKFFNKSILDLLQIGDNNEHSKKDADKRANEILLSSKNYLLSWAAKNVERCLEYTNLINIIISIMVTCIPDSEDDLKLYNQIISDFTLFINEEMIPDTVPTLKRENTSKSQHQVAIKKRKTYFANFKMDEEDNNEEPEVEEHKIKGHLLENLSGQFLVKELCKLVKEKKINNFCDLVMKNVDVENIQSFIKSNRTAFFLVNLYETENTEFQEYLKVNLKSMKGEMKKSKFTGVQILTKYLF